MKTKEQIRAEIISYVEKTSRHTFKYADHSYFKVKLADEISLSGDQNIISYLDKAKVTTNPININKMIEWYGGNAKNVIQSILFANRTLTAVKNTKYIKEILGISWCN